MTGVEQPQFHRLVGPHVVDQQNTRLLERRAAVGEVVLEHPAGERLGQHRPFVGDAEIAFCRGDDLGGGGRGDAVHHRGREPGEFGDPVGEVPAEQFGMRDDGPPRDLPVVLDVVARHDGRRADAAVAAPGQRVGDQAEDGPTVPDLVAALGDGHRDDAGGRGGQQLDRGLRIVGSVAVVDDRADHPRIPAAVGVFEDQRVQPVLGAQHVSHAAVGRHHSDPADAPLPRQTPLQQPVDVHGLMRPMKPTDTDMRDADPDAVTVVARRRDRQLPQGGVAQPNHGFDGTGSTFTPWLLWLPARRDSG